MEVRLIVRMWLTWFAGDRGWGAVVEQGLFPYFPPLKPRYILWSGASYSPKNMVCKQKVWFELENQHGIFC